MAGTRLIDLDVQDRGRNFEDRQAYTKPIQSFSTSKVKVEFLNFPSKAKNCPR